MSVRGKGDIDYSEKYIKSKKTKIEMYDLSFFLCEKKQITSLMCT